MRWGAIPIGLVMLGLAWLGWNIDNPTDNEIVVPAIIVDVEANAPTVEFVDIDFEIRQIVGPAEDRPPRIGDQREVMLTSDSSADPRLRNSNSRGVIKAFAAVGLFLVVAPFLGFIWRFVLAGGTAIGAGLLARRAGDIVPKDVSGNGSLSGDVEALTDAARAEKDDQAARSAGKEAAGALLVAEGVTGIDNPFSSRNRGGLYSSALGIIAGVGLLLYAPIAGALFTGEPDDVRVEATAVEWMETTRRNDEGEIITLWVPTFSYVDPATGITYQEQTAGRQLRGAIGETTPVAFDPDNPSSVVFISPRGHWVRPVVRAFGGLFIAISLGTLVIRSVALFAGLRLLTAGRAERRATGDQRSTLTVLKDSATAIIDHAGANMPAGSRGTVLSTLVAIRREGRDSESIQAAKDIVGATVLADSLFGLERPFDGEKKRYGIFGNIVLTAVFAALAIFGIWLGNILGYEGDRSTAVGTVVEIVGDDATIEYRDSDGQSWSIVEDDGIRQVGQQIQVVFEQESPEVAVVATRHASALRWLLLGIGVFGVVALVPTVVMQAAGVVLGLGLLVGFRRA